MGMFDSVYVNGVEFQTKELDNLCEEYTYDTERHLIIRSHDGKDFKVSELVRAYGDSTDILEVYTYLVIKQNGIGELGPGVEVLESEGGPDPCMMTVNITLMDELSDCIVSFEVDDSYIGIPLTKALPLISDDWSQLWNTAFTFGSLTASPKLIDILSRGK